METQEAATTLEFIFMKADRTYVTFAGEDDKLLRRGILTIQYANWVAADRPLLVTVDI